jgi:hypothetical protein
MARTKASATASILSHTLSHRLQRESQFDQDPESRIDVEAKEVTAASVGRLGPEGPIIEGSSATDSDDDDFVYDRERFCKYKAHHRFKYYNKRRVVVKRGLEVADFDVRPLCIRKVLEAQGWTEMVKDYRPAIEELVREFYTNLHRRVDDSFLTWVKGKKIHVTLDLISTIIGASWVSNPEYPWSVDHLPIGAEMVKYFTEGQPHKMEMEGEGNF